MCFGNVPMQAAANNTEAEPPTEATGANAGDPFVRQQLDAHAARIESIRSTVDIMAARLQQASGDARTLRLREIAIDTAIRNSNITNSGPSNGPGAIVAAAAVYYAFLDTGAVPA